MVTPWLRQAGITRVAVVSGLDDCPVPVVMVTRPLSCSLSVTQGKGLTLDAAKASGIMEAIEHFHAETAGGELRLASEHELADQCVSGTRLAGRLPRYSPQRRVMWQLGETLVTKRPLWVPFDLVHLDLRVDGVAAAPCFVPNSNGLASGNTHEEAVAHALYELIERHATAEFYELTVEEQERRRLNNGAIIDAECRELVEALTASKLAVTVWDLTTELGIPCFLCEVLGERDELRLTPIARGFGCHGVSGVALSRAITEALQSRVTTITGSRDDMIPEHSVTRAVRDAQAREQWRLRALAPAQRLFRAIPSREFASFAEENAWLTGTLLSHGFDEPVVVNLSKPEWPVAVVRVLSPGLRFGPTEAGSKAARIGGFEQ